MMKSISLNAENLYKQFLNAFIVDKNIDKTLSYLSDDICGILWDCEAPIYGIEEFKAFMENLSPSIYNVSDIVFKDMNTRVIDLDSITIFAEFYLYDSITFLVKDEAIVYQTVSLHKVYNNYKIHSIHTSMKKNTANDLAPPTTMEEISSYYKSILNGLPIPISITTNDRKIHFLNRYSLELLKKPLDDCIGKPCCEVWNASICNTDNCGIHRLLHGKKHTYYDLPGKNLRVDASYIKDSHGNTLGFIEIGNNITEIKEATEKLTALAANIPDGVCEVAIDGRFTLQYGNDAFYKILGFTREQFSKKYKNQLIYLLYPEDVKAVESCVNQAIKAGNSNIIFEKRIYKFDGSLIWILVSGTLVKENTILYSTMVDISERRNYEQELKNSEERLRIALNRTSNIVFDYNIKNKQMIQTDGTAILYGLPRVMEDAPNSLIETGTICKESHQDFLKMYTEIRRGDPNSTCIVKTYDQFGKVIWNRITMTSIYDVNHKPDRAIGLIEDITKQKEMEMAYFQEEQYRNAMLSDVLLYIEMNITKDSFCKWKGNWNFEFEGDTEYKYSSIHKLTVENSILDEFKDEYFYIFCRENVIKSFHEGICELKYDYKRKMDEGKIAWMQTTMTLIQDTITEDIKGFTYVRDIDSRKKEELQLEFASHHDMLTNIYNKSYTETKVKEVLTSEHDKNHAFIILDVDHFKSINDTYGHYMGDRILAQTAQCLVTIFSPKDIIGRVGGDEFVVFVRDIIDVSTVYQLSQCICDNFSHPLSSIPNFPIISCSIGFSITGLDGNSFEELYKNADYALYKAKKLGRNRYIQYCPDIKNENFKSYSGSKIDN